MTDALRLNSISKQFGADVGLAGVSLTVGQGEFVTILGPSGSGKTTTLRLVAGLECPDTGTVSIQGTNVTLLPPYKRDCAMVFQSYALFPHRSIADNIAFGPVTKGLSGSDTTALVRRLLMLVGLDGQEDKRPHQLSGGQQQRVALARALAVDPAILLLDEPLGALDLALRRQMQSELRTIQRETGRAFLHVTHDQGEALALSDRLVVMDKGRIAQIGTPEEVYEQPANRFVAAFMGFRNILPIEQRQRMQPELWFTIAGAEMSIRVPASLHSGPIVAAIRPEHIRLEDAEDDCIPGVRWSGMVRELVYAGDHYEHTVALECGSLIEAVTTTAFPVGSRVDASVQPRHIVLLPG